MLKVKKIILLLGCVLNIIVYAQPGSLDYTFGSAGIVLTDFGNGDDWGKAVALQNDGKIVVAGYSGSGPGADFALVRYNTDGSLDNAFGFSGKVTTDIDTSWEQGWSIALQNDGKILLGGSSAAGGPWDFALIRYKSNGSLDSSFGMGGIVTTDFGNSGDLGTSVAIQSDGRIVLAGWKDFGSCDFALARYKIDGNLDSTFGLNGKVLTDFGGEYDRAWSLAIQSDGKIVLAGSTNVFSATTNYDFALARYNLNGSLDNSFGVGGKVVTDFGSSNENCYSILIQSDGKILAAGYSNTVSSNSDFALARYTPNGSLDVSFGSNGKVITDLGTIFEYGFSLGIESDGKILLAGSSGNGPYSFALVRYNSNGSLDNTFDSDGKVFTTIGANSKGFSTAVTGDGKIVVAGFSDQDFAVARYIGCSQASYSLSDSPCDNYGLSLPENYVINDIAIYPNPTSGVFNVRLKHRTATSEVNVYDLLGNCLWTKDFRNEANLEMDLNDYSKGIYFIEIISDIDRSRHKLILK